MGCFDSINIEMVCPYCGKESLMEAQTKELECILKVWKLDDFVSKKYNYLDCHATCKSDECMEYMKEKHSNIIGFGRGFTVKVYLKHGCVSGKYRVKQEKEGEDKI